MRRPPPELPKARGIDETGPAAPPTYLLRRGDFTARGPEMAPAFPAVLANGERMRGQPTPRRTRAAAAARWRTGWFGPIIRSRPE